MIKFTLEEIKQLSIAATKINNYILGKYTNDNIKITVDKFSNITVILEIREDVIIISMKQGYNTYSMKLYDNNDYNYKELTYSDEYIRRPNMLWRIVGNWESVKGKLDISKALIEYRKNKIKNFEV